jgi:hypothetical protein
VVDSPGDNLLAEFDSVVQAVQCAFEIQADLKVRNNALPQERRMLFRIGINLGDVIVDGERIYGDGVNVAARLESLAAAGGICVSRSAFEQIENKFTFGCEELGDLRVKNIARPIGVYRVWVDGDNTGCKPARKAGMSPALLKAFGGLLALAFLAGAGNPIWAERYTGDMKNIFSLEKGLIQWPEFSGLHIVLAAAYAQTNRMDAAAEAASEVRRLEPFFELYSFGSALRNPSDRDKLIVGLRKAGLK